jgi:predicted extracellular nuclease
MDLLVAAVVDAGGPRYEWRQIDPEDGHDGGVPGANIRVAFLFNPQRVTFVDRGPCREALVIEGPTLSCSPGRVAPADPAFAGDPERGAHGTRKSLAGEFLYRGQRLFVINNHLSSKIGDDQPFGARQPPERRSERQRLAQAKVLREFVDQLMALDPEARIIVLGDFNEFEDRAPLRLLAGHDLENLVERVAPEDRYSYIFRGKAQAIDHILVSAPLARDAEVDVVHLSSELPASRRASDHDPVVASFGFPPTPSQ